MVRVKKGKSAHKRQKHLLEYAKGYKWGRKSKYKLAKRAVIRAWAFAFSGRKAKKRNFRQLWQAQINAACRAQGISYSRFIEGLKKNKIDLNRKILSQLAQQQPETFKKIVEKVKS